MSATLSHEAIVKRRVTRAAKRFGYVLAAALNAVMLWAAYQLLDWGWPGWLTPRFDELLPVITTAFVVSILVNLVYVWKDEWPIKPIGEMMTSAIGFAVAVRTYRVFPFDFSGYDVDWSWLARFVVIVVIVGTAIGVVAQIVKLAQGPPGNEETP